MTEEFAAMRVRLAMGALAMLTSVSIGSGAFTNASEVHATQQVPIQVMKGTQYGVNIKWLYRTESKAALNNQLKATLTYIKNLGANSVTFAFNIYVDSPTSNTVIAGFGTPPASLVGYVSWVSRRYGFNVLLRPLITETNPNAPWRGEIEPKNRNAWFKSYDKFLKPYLVAAQKDGASEFAYSCELQSLQGSKGWKSIVLPFMKKYFKRPLMYDAGWDSPGLAPMANQLYGIDAYPPAQLGDSATVKQLVAAWNAWLKREPILAPTDETYLIEVGIAAQSGAYLDPSYFSYKTPIVPAVQAKWFQAACDFFHQHKFKGIYFWATNLDEGPQTSPIGETPEDFQGASLPVISRCFTRS
jgi:hypothetical protein